MTSEQFAYWLQGYVELTGGERPSPEAWKSICEHLNTVFKKITPPLTLPFPGNIFVDGNKFGSGISLQTLPPGTITC